MKDILKFGSFLMIVAGIAAASLSITYILCSEKIASQQMMERMEAQKEVLPEADSFIETKRAINGKEIDCFVGRKNRNNVGVVLMVSPQGYGGAIDMVVGVDTKGRVTGVKILKLNETPGLGLNAAEKKFLAQFKRKSLEDKLKAKLDIQMISGATITTQAVGNGVREALEIYKGLGKK